MVYQQLGMDGGGPWGTPARFGEEEIIAIGCVPTGDSTRLSEQFQPTDHTDSPGKGEWITNQTESPESGKRLVGRMGVVDKGGGEWEKGEERAIEVRYIQVWNCQKHT